MCLRGLAEEVKHHVPLSTVHSLQHSHSSGGLAFKTLSYVICMGSGPVFK